MCEASAGFISTLAMQKKTVVRGFEVETPDKLLVARMSRSCSCVPITDTHRYIL